MKFPRLPLPLRSFFRFDLPLRERAASRFLPWAIGGLLYVAVVALAVAALADEALRSQGVAIRMVTVTLPPGDDVGRGADAMADALDILRGAPGVISAVPVPAPEVAALLEPWLGGAEGEPDLPLPGLIDLTLDSRAEVDLAKLEERLRGAVAGATIGEEVFARDRAEPFAAFLRACGIAAGTMALLVGVVLVGLITRASLHANAEALELLRCLGASDGYLARQFERHALLSGLQGGLLGLVLALATVLAMVHGSDRMQLDETVELDLSATNWLLLAGVPLIAALLATAVARITALWGLIRTP